ncbi:DUF6760 family protein [Angelakisella massiliensis]|uniref:DUF6760 family protein n=1 Tax=Angelakisella massiliensis TaxID=1871018 RepID=UPI0032C437A7
MSLRLSSLRARGGCPGKFYGNHRIRLYAQDKLYEESAFLAYYTHWSREEILQMSHQDRIKWCGEISKINGKINAASGQEERKNVFSI